MSNNILPARSTMYKALIEKDSSFEGIFFVGIKTTGIFCRPTCNAKKPKEENVEYFPSTREAILQGYRPCKMCNPLEYKGNTPEWLRPLMNEIEQNPSLRLTDYELMARGLNPGKVRRWFKNNLGITFQSYLRTLRIGQAFGRIKIGEKIISTAFDSDYNSLSGFNSSFKKTMGLTPTESRNKKIIHVTRILTPLGPMLAGALDDKLCLLEFVDRRMIETQIKRLKQIFKAELVPGNQNIFNELNIQLKEYFDGKRKEFTIPMAFDGTPFQVKVWNALLNIPYGETASYKKQAITLGIHNAVRAVGKANGDNRIAILIPCHRVIGENGKLVGYGGGIWRKQYLLNLEKRKEIE